MTTANKAATESYILSSLFFYQLSNMYTDFKQVKHNAKCKALFPAQRSHL